MITRYERPTTLAEATSLLAQPGAFILAGGTTSIPVSPDGIAVDIQALGFEPITLEQGVVRIGATTTLADIASSDEIPAVISDLARREAPNTIRNAATIGGTIGTNDPESELLAGLVAHRALVTIHRAGSASTEGLAQILANPSLLNGAIITEVGFEATGDTVAHRTGRTPMDRPIVAVVAHRDAQGDVTLGITGVATHVVEAGHTDLDRLAPPADFRGSSAYRMHLVRALTQRSMDDLNTGGVS